MLVVHERAAQFDHITRVLRVELRVTIGVGTRVLVGARTMRVQSGWLGKAEPRPTTVAVTNSPSVDSAAAESLAALARYIWEVVG